MYSLKFNLFFDLCALSKPKILVIVETIVIVSASCYEYALHDASLIWDAMHECLQVF
jgi:hypothetical protein